MKEISVAIVSITLVMAAVFVPVMFMQGPVGVFYKQFAFTLSIAILISAFNALTLSPALCALFLAFNPEHGAHAHGQHNGSPGYKQNQGFIKSFLEAFNIAFNTITAHNLH